jgi:hypothetical protein
MSNRVILVPVRSHVDGVHTDVHIIPDDQAGTSEGSLAPTLKKRQRSSLDESEHAPTGPNALETLRTLGCLTHSVTSSLVRREAADLNGKLLAIEHRRLAGNCQKRSSHESEPTEREKIRILTPSSGEHSAQRRSTSTDGEFGTADNDTDQDVNILWRRVNRNKRVAVMLRDFEVLHRLLLFEMKEMMQDQDEPS